VRTINLHVCAFVCFNIIAILVVALLCICVCQPAMREFFTDICDVTNKQQTRARSNEIESKSHKELERDVEDVGSLSVHHVTLINW